MDVEQFSVHDEQFGQSRNDLKNEVNTMIQKKLSVVQFYNFYQYLREVVPFIKIMATKPRVSSVSKASTDKFAFDEY